MAIKITVEKVDNGVKDNGSFPMFTFAQQATQPDQLPIEIVLRESNATGVTIDTLKKFLTLANKGKLNTAEAIHLIDAHLADTIDGVYAELNT